MKSFTEKVSKKNKMLLELFLLQFCSITLFNGHQLSLSGPNLKPDVLFQGIHSPINFPRNKLSVDFLHHDDTTGKMLLAVDDTLLLVNFSGEIDRQINLPCENSAKTCKSESQRRAYGVLKERVSSRPNLISDVLAQTSAKKQIYFCIFDSTTFGINLMQRPQLKRIDLDTFKISNQDNWPPNYCSSNENLSPNFQVVVSPTSVSTVEVWPENRLMVRWFTSETSPKMHEVKDSDILQLVDTFIQAGVTFYLTRERIPSVSVHKPWAYVNKISRSCKENVTQKFFRNTKALRCVFTQVSLEP